MLTNEDVTKDPQTLMDRRLLVRLEDFFNATGKARGRLFNHLWSADIRHVGDIYNYCPHLFDDIFTPAQLIKTIEGVGSLSLAELEAHLQNIGLNLQDRPHGTALWNTLSRDQVEASPVSADELQQMLKTDAADGPPAALAQPVIDRRLLVRTDDFLNFHGYGKNGGKLGQVLSAAGALYLGDVINRDFPEGLAPAAKRRLIEMLDHFGLQLQATMSATEWSTVNPVTYQPVNAEELRNMHEAELQRREDEDRRLREEASRQAAEVEAERIAAIQRHFTQAQQTLLQPQSVEIDDPDVTALQAKIPGGILEESDLRDGDRSNGSKLVKLAIALVTLEGEQPDFLFVTTQGEYKVVRITGVIGKLTEENRALLGLVKTPTLGSSRKNYESFSPRSNVFGNEQKYFLVKEPECLARIGIVPQNPIVRIKGQAEAEAPQNG